MVAGAVPLKGHSGTVCSRVGCPDQAAWRVAFVPKGLVTEPALSAADPVTLCSGCLALIEAWGWGVDVRAASIGS